MSRNDWFALRRWLQDRRGVAVAERDFKRAATLTDVQHQMTKILYRQKSAAKRRKAA